MRAPLGRRADNEHKTVPRAAPDCGLIQKRIRLVEEDQDSSLPTQPGAVAMYDDDDDPFPAGPKPPRPSDPSEAIFRWIGLIAGLGVCAFMTLFFLERR